MDTYKEQMVKKAANSTDQIKKNALIILGISLAGIILAFSLMLPSLIMIGIFAAIGIFYGVFYLLKDFNIEYEYLYTNGDIDIDKIIGQRKRKRLVSFNIHTVTDFKRYNEDEISGDNTVIDATTGLDDEHWCMFFNHKSYGDCCLVFTPDEGMLELLIDNLPKSVRFNIKK